MRCSSKRESVGRRKIFPLCAIKVGAATVAPFHGGRGLERIVAERYGEAVAVWSVKFSYGTVRLGMVRRLRLGAAWKGTVRLGVAVLVRCGRFRFGWVCFG